MASFHLSGKKPSFRDKLIMLVMIGRRSCKQSLAIWIGTGSFTDDLLGELVIRLRT